MARIIFIITTLILSFVVKAQDLEKSLLWKISGNGLEKPSYLYGTIHAACEVNLDENVMKAFDETAQLYLEIDIDDANLNSKMMAGMMMKNDEKLTNLYSEEDAILVDEFLVKNVGVSIEMLNSMKPFVLNTMILPILLECPMKSVEEELIKISKNQKEDILGLETVEYQLAVFDEIPYKSQANDFLKTVKSNMMFEKEEIKKMLEIYKNQDIEALMKLMQESDKEMMTKYDDVLLTKRNKNWIPIIAKVSKEKPTIFAVGAGHLAGDEGVIKLLQKQGFTVEAVK